jgi:membrane protein DedA with SNARE-associated domain
MEDLIQYIGANVQYAHWIIFGMLLLAGLNIPVSEDAMLFISAVLASNHPEYLPQLFTGVFLGAYFSDLICYTLGLKFGPKLFEIKFFANMVPPERIQKIHNYYDQYGVVTLILGRFIPFGVRNGLFLTAGLGKMDPVKFAMSDLLACTISTITFFTLYYHYGNAVVESIKSGNKFIFSIAILLVVVYFVRKKIQQAEDEDQDS